MCIEDKKIRVCPKGYGHCLCGGFDRCPAAEREAVRSGWEPHRQDAKDWLTANGLKQQEHD